MNILTTILSLSFYFFHGTIYSEIVENYNSLHIHYEPKKQIYHWQETGTLIVYCG